MAASEKTSLSAGAVIRDLLLGSAAVTALTDKVYPVATDTALLPYVIYRRSALEHNPTKAGQPGADTVQIEVACYAKTYAESVALAEAVRSALDYAQGASGGVKMRSCTLSDSEEAWQDDAFLQLLTFSARI